MIPLLVTLTHSFFWWWSFPIDIAGFKAESGRVEDWMGVFVVAGCEICCSVFAHLFSGGLGGGGVCVTKVGLWEESLGRR